MHRIAYRVSETCSVACLGLDDAGLARVRKKIEENGYEELPVEEFQQFAEFPVSGCEDSSSEESQPEDDRRTRSRTASNVMKKNLGRRKKSGKPKKGRGRKSKGYRNKR